MDDILLPSQDQNANETQDQNTQTTQPSAQNGENADAQSVGTTDAQDVGTSRKLTSVVWNHFKREKINGQRKAICNYCNKKLSGKGSHGTTHLHDHYKGCMSRKNNDIRHYWTHIHGITAIATILDPRFKMKVIEYYFPQIYGAESPKEVERIRKLTYDLVKEYKPHGAKETHSIFGNADFSMDVDDFGDSLAGFDLFVSSTSSVDTYKSELDYYLEENVLPRTGDFDILAWWKTNGLKYPTLQQVVRDVLAIPVTSVASESAFSTGGRHITPHRNRLHPDLVEQLVCSQDWLWDDNLDSNKQKKYLNSEVVKDDDSGPSYVDFDT